MNIAFVDVTTKIILSPVDSKIPMTAPVLREVYHGPGPACESTFLTHFMIPFSLQANTPDPTDPTVYIRDLPALKVFVR
jgi:hypothetical protein